MRDIRKRPAGWRTLRVGELELWWTVGKPRVTAKLATEPGPAVLQAIELSIIVERADGSGKKLVATVRGKRGLAIPAAGFADVQTIAVEPSAVRRLVELAAPRGAWPTGVGNWTTELDLPHKPLPEDLSFRPEHLDRMQIVWRK